MTHTELSPGTLRAFLDGEVSPEQTVAIPVHLSECAACRATLQDLKGRAEMVQTAMTDLPESQGSESDLPRLWAAFARKRDALPAPRFRWPAAKTWWVASGTAVTAALLLLTLAPVRGWAQELLAIFRVEHFTVLEVNPEMGANLQNNQLLNQSVGHMLSDNVKVTQQPQQPQPIPDEAGASALAGFHARFLPGVTPTTLLLESGAAAQFTLDRERLQSILDEAGRTDLQIPSSVDGAQLSFRIAPGILATYAQCADGQPQNQVPAPCITLMQVPSPVVTAPRGFDPAQLAQVGLQFLGMSANDATHFIGTVDWTSTLVLPVPAGTMTYKQIPINGVEGVLLRQTNSTASDRFTLTWVDRGIVYAIQSYGDDANAANLAAQLN